LRGNHRTILGGKSTPYPSLAPAINPMINDLAQSWINDTLGSESAKLKVTE
jgi:hypothetical protein